MSLNLFHFKILSKFGGVRHGVTTRVGGVSELGYSSLNLSYKCHDLEDHVSINRQLLANELKVSSEMLLFPDQCHTANVKVINSIKDNNLTQTDALITNKKNIAIGVLAADCVPVLFYDFKNRTIAAAHAGWKGTVQNIASACLHNMAIRYNTHPKDVFVGIGPAIQMDNYQVGEEVVDALNKLPITAAGKYIKPDGNDKFRVDLQQINRQLLMTEGVPENQIEIMDYCTYNHPDLFFSARRDGFESGRFGAVIMLD